MISLRGVAAVLFVATLGCGAADVTKATEPVVPELPRLLFDVSAQGHLTADSARHACTVVARLSVTGATSVRVIGSALPGFSVISTRDGVVTATSAWSSGSMLADGAKPGDPIEYVVNYYEGSLLAQRRATVACASPYRWITDTVVVSSPTVTLFPNEFFGGYSASRPPDTSAPKLVECEVQYGPGPWQRAEVRNDTIRWGEWPGRGYFWPSGEMIHGGCWVWVWDWRSGSGGKYVQQGSPMFRFSEASSPARVRAVRSYWARR